MSVYLLKDGAIIMKKTNADQFTVEHHKLSDCHEAIYFHHRQTHEAVLAINEEITPSEHLLDIARRLHEDCLDEWVPCNQEVIVYQFSKIEDYRPSAPLATLDIGHRRRGRPRRGE